MTPEHAGPPTALALWYVAPRTAELRDTPVAPPGPDDARVRTRYSALSRGTERLVFEGAVPESERDRMRAPAQRGEFPFPVAYGYAAVGTVTDGPAALLDRTVFALHPHQSHFVLPAAALVPVPDAVPARRAVLAANAETALNALWDGGALPGMRIAVVGGGVVGALVAWLAGRLPGAEVVLVDRLASRAALARALGVDFALPQDAPRDCDRVFHASASSAGLATALAAVGDEGEVVELSWYGNRPVSVDLGAHFHSGRLRIVGSQVGRIAPAMRARWTYRRRLAKALELLADERVDALLEPDVPFARLPDALPELLGADRPLLCPVVAYD
jgi:2-desacetyl-2-hydroxyethyl bacteriochlorophyllide A dehydrogenase